MTDGPAARRRRTGLLAAVGLTALLAIYVWLVALRAVQLIGTGQTVGVVLGVALLVAPLLVLALITREWLLAIDVQRMADELAATGDLPVDDLPRSPSGRIDRAAARAAFAPHREQVEADPGDWRGWYRLAFAYDAAGDRSRARAALRTASRLHRGKGAAADLP
ncbi:hypothetical protein J1G42_11010 [Cellulomonas sp. zg-ZUI222]|uniref:Tetratrico peptide repeat group 5 domain-containing protein n=1 Tax=Cellulomonas wangleii TaxID=2816956 RepID=A0ABX8DBU6_9CELL|nr:hypothetical protein [Cellulomonas wangleii]MBO0921355.1 hypothetical protein [Cellulomonas wangleii]MBO0925771.1 hypothetical protein [Cellulomonas wangleii]QVI63707.1 hypothetical protein KG103_07665 [Cellulomonas wangleii]